MNFRATVDKPNDRTEEGVRGEAWQASQTSRRTRESQNFLTFKVGHTDDLHDLKRAREREREWGNVRSRRVVGGTGGEGVDVGVGFGFFWGFCTRWQLSNFSTSRQIKFCIFMSQSRRVKSEIIRGTFCVVCVSLYVCVCLTLALNKSESHTNCILFGYHFCLCLSLCVSPRLSLSGNINLFI